MYTFTIYTIYTEPDTEGRGGGWTLDALALAILVQSGRDVSVQHGVRWRLVAQQTLQVSLHICRVYVRKETYKRPTNVMRDLSHTDGGAADVAGFFIYM